MPAELTITRQIANTNALNTNNERSFMLLPENTASRIYTRWYRESLRAIMHKRYKFIGQLYLLEISIFVKRETSHRSSFLVYSID